MIRFYLPLFWKFSISIILTVIVFGVINLILARNDINSIIEQETKKKSTLVSNYFFKHIENYLDKNDTTKLNEELELITMSDSTIAYAAVYYSEKQKNFRANHFIINNLEIPESYQKDKIEYLDIPGNNKLFLINISRKISSKPLIYSAIGLLEEKTSIRAKQFYMPIVFTILIFLIVGIISAFLYARVITRPINKIVTLAENLEIKSYLDKKEDSRNLLWPINKIFQQISVLDELDILQDKFFEMLKKVRKAYKEKEQSYTKLIQAEKLASIGTLTAGVAHEINNPIAGIKNCTRRIKENPENIKQNIEYIDLMDDAVDKIENVVKRLLDYSRTPDMNIEHINIRNIINKSILLISYKFEKHHISINNKVSNNISTIEGNFNQLEQVFVNIFLNSIDAIESRKAVDKKFPLLIEISAYEKQDSVIVEIKDTGIGIDDNSMEMIFDPFFTTKEVGKGTGLGLFVSYNILKSHKGSIKVESTSHKGTRFIIELKKKMIS